MSLLGALAGQNVFLYGPPGTAKSMISRRLSSIFDDCIYYECLLQKYSTPEDIFGPISIKELKEDRYTRKTEGFLPEADVAFLDEIWKSSPAILNTLLTILNEKKFRNGNKDIDVPLLFAIAASNEIPSSEQGLNALYDRFPIRIPVFPISNAKAFRGMVSSSSNVDNSSIVKAERITRKEIELWRDVIKNISVTEECLTVIKNLREMLSESIIYVSDRKWVQAVHLIKASAFFSGRDKTDLCDCLVLTDCLWDKYEDRAAITDFVANAYSKECLGVLKGIDEFESYCESLFYKSDEFDTQFNKAANSECFDYTLTFDCYLKRGPSSTGIYKFSIPILIPDFRVKDSSWWHPLNKEGLEIKSILAMYNEDQGGIVFSHSISPDEVVMDVDKRRYDKCCTTHDDVSKLVIFRPPVRHKKGTKKLRNKFQVSVDDSKISTFLDQISKVQSVLFYRKEHFIQNQEHPFVEKELICTVVSHLSDKLEELKKGQITCDLLKHKLL